MYGVHGRSLLVVAISVALWGGCGGSSGSLDLEASTLSVDRHTAVADGSDAIAMTAHLVDTSGHPVAGCAVTFAATGSGNTISAPATTSTSGDASGSLSSRVAEQKSITASVECQGEAASPLVTSADVQFTHGPVTQLAFVVQPSNTDVDVALAPAVVIAVEDGDGNVATDAAGTISVALATNPGNVVLAGTAQLALSSGIASFADLEVAVPGQQYQLDATSSVTTATTTSDPFDVSYGPPSSASSLVLMPPAAPADGTSEIAAVVTLVNAGGAGIPDLPVSVTMPGGDVFPHGGQTDSNGRFVTKLTSAVAGMPTVTATSGSVVLTATATFTVAPCTPLMPGLPTTAGPGFAGIFASDFDGDGHQDLAVLHAGDLAIMRGTRDGRLHLPYSFATATGNIDLAGGDLDNDGDVDLVTANATSIVTFMGQGAGQFTALAPLALPAPPKNVALGDFNGDGKLDLAVRTEQTVVIALGNGDGTFAPPASYPLGFTQSISTTAIIVADANGDARPDVVTLGSNRAVSTLIANANGTLQPAVTSSSYYYAGTVAAADFDGDGILDLVPPDPSGLYLMHGNGDGTFRVGSSFEFFGASSAAAADVNGDGHADVIASAGSAMPEVRVYLGAGNGTFQAPQVYGVVSYGIRFLLADFDGDGHRDLVVAQQRNPATGFLTILSGAPAGTFVGEHYVGDAPGAVRRHFPPIAGDFNGDGRPDLVALNTSTGTWAAQLMAANGTVTEAASFTDSGTSYAAADFNHDGKMDLLFGANGSAQCVRGNGDGTFQTPTSSVFGGSSYLIAADFNHDGNPDVAGVTFTPSSVHVGLGKGDGTFLADQAFTVADYPQYLQAADLNADGNIDLVTVNRNVQGSVPVGNLSVLLGNGDGTFQTARTVSVGGEPTTVVAADFNGDGNLDLAVGNIGTATPQISLLKGHGDGSFDPEVMIGAGTQSAVWLRAADIDGDGHIDLLSIYNSVTVLRGVGDGTFRAPLLYPGGAASNAAVADFDLDGRLDLMLGADDLSTNGAVGYGIVRNLGCR